MLFYTLYSILQANYDRIRRQSRSKKRAVCGKNDLIKYFKFCLFYCCTRSWNN